jgi:hypothetical protein
MNRPPGLIPYCAASSGITSNNCSTKDGRSSSRPNTVAPLSAIETLLGKYLSYLIFGGVMAAILSALVIYGLRVPMLGLPQHYALAVAALLFTSRGYGFAISLI